MRALQAPRSPTGWHIYGFTPTIVEKAPRLRTGGYIIDFWGAGFEIADRMGLLPEIRRKGYTVQELRVVNQNGERMAGFPVEAFFRATGGRYISLPRSELRWKAPSQRRTGLRDVPGSPSTGRAIHHARGPYVVSLYMG